MLLPAERTNHWRVLVPTYNGLEGSELSKNIVSINWPMRIRSTSWIRGR
jgi:hypothetical protein